ncbi:MAG TPA: AAA family ATPase, partial [Spirochaetota bacterium]|nr:AAA family ATPase [Spirochaetota bacterium]
MKKLPIGIQSFVEIRTENYYYADKTPFVKKLSDSG